MEDETRTFISKVYHKNKRYYYHKINDKKTTTPKVNSNDEFPPLHNNSIKRDPQLGVWKNKITITNEPPSAKVKLSTYLHNSTDNLKKNKNTIEIIDCGNLDIEDDYMHDRHTYLNDDEYYSSD